MRTHRNGERGGISSSAPLAAHCYREINAIGSAQRSARSLLVRAALSETWQTFLRNHADAIAAIDLCVGSDA